MLEALKKAVLQANKDLPLHGLVKLTWGNVSGIDRKKKLIVIKPSGVEYKDLTLKSLVVLDLQGKIIEGALNPSSDTPTHLELYRQFEEIGGIVHTHSEWSTSWAQAGLDIPTLGTTHADCFYGNIPCTRSMTSKEIKTEYELNTGKVIVETFKKRKLNAQDIPGVLVKNHGPFVWGNNPDNALHNAIVIDEVAKMALRTYLLNPKAPTLSQVLLDKHFLRKHGKNAYYGQKKS